MCCHRCLVLMEKWLIFWIWIIWSRIRYCIHIWFCFLLESSVITLHGYEWIANKVYTHPEDRLQMDHTRFSLQFKVHVLLYTLYILSTTIASMGSCTRNHDMFIVLFELHLYALRTFWNLCKQWFFLPISKSAPTLSIGKIWGILQKLGKYKLFRI